jgi:tetratricopeptide (TPR) repeat protein
LDLLFHLGRGLAGARILLIAAYRPDEVTADKEHPLQRLLDEFRRSYGDVWLDLNRPPGRAFIDAFIDSEANGLDEAFRETFFRRTGSHPLFMVELLHDMQERGDLVMDETSTWRARPSLDWDALPARVEGAIEARIGRLDEALRDILGVAAVEGEAFTAQVVAHVQEIQERQLLRTLSRELERRHKLVREQEEVQTRWGILSRYKFSHALFQDYLYKHLSSGERRLLHGDVASALEKLFEGEVEEIVLQLGHHFSEARDYARALPYFAQAANRAARIHANDEAVAHYTRALELIGKVTSVEGPSQAELYRGRGLACQKLGDFDRARPDFETALEMAHEADKRQLEWRLLLDLGKLWASRDYQRTRDYFEQALDLARRMDDAVVLGRTLNWMGNWFANAENPVTAAEFQLEALEIFQDLGDRQDLAITLDLLGNANLLGGDLTASVGYYDRAIALFQELEDHPRLVSSLMGRGTIVSISILLATAPPSKPPDALEDIKEAVRIAQEIHAPSEEAWASWSLGLLYTARGQFGPALDVASKGLRIATELGHREWTVGNHFALGVLYVELLEPGEAKAHLEEALSQAQGLRSQYWINHVAGALAATYFLLNDLPGAQTAIETAISSQTAMDTMGKRYCWARRAELALLHDDPALALDIVDRLIASAPGMPAGRVITFLWQLKGEALAAMGRAGEAEPLLQTAARNAQALGERFLLWRAYASLGRLYREMNRPEEAQEHFSTARELVKELAATIPEGALQDSYLQRALVKLQGDSEVKER